MSLSASEIKQIRALQQKKFRKETGLFVVEGVKSVESLVRSDLELTAIYCTETLSFLDDVNPSLVHIIKQNELERISGLRTPNRILAVAKIPESQPVDWETPLILLLDGINDPGNIGTIIRTAKWFGVDTIICSEECADAYDRKVVQSTMGALFHVNVTYGNLLAIGDTLKSNGFQLIGAAMSGDSVYSMPHSKKSALIIGSESHGINQELISKCDGLVTIPNLEKENVESLNAGIATSIILSELTRSR